MKQIKDALLNSYEFWEDLNQEATELVLSLDLSLTKEQENKMITNVKKMMKSWIENDNNFRIDVELNYHKNPQEYEEKLDEFIKNFVKIN
jgi:hypothetical protein